MANVILLAAVVSGFVLGCHFAFGRGYEEGHRDGLVHGRVLAEAELVIRGRSAGAL